MSKKEWLDPTPEMLETEEFNAIWEVIKTWDINVPGVYAGYCGATGNHVRAILDAIKALEAQNQCTELPEKKDNVNCFKEGGSIREYRRGFNFIHDIASPIIARQKREIREKHLLIVELQQKLTEAEEAIRTGKCKHIAEDVISAECSLCHLAWCELRIKVLEKKLSNTEKELERMKRWVNDHPEIKQLREKIRELEEELAKERE